MSDINKQLSNYVRAGYSCFNIVAIMFIIFFKIIGLRCAVTLGITAGILNLVPYLGSFLAIFACSGFGSDSGA